MSDIMIHSFGATSRRILICEDNRLIAMGWAVVLAGAGYHVVGPVHAAEKALELAHKDPPDLALIDIALGGTIDGISVAAELVPLGTSVIFVTADYQRAAVEGRTWAIDILIKPVADTTVLHSVALALQNKREIDRGGAVAKSDLACVQRRH
jgi:DNA-binding response OmpR family regulator